MKRNLPWIVAGAAVVALVWVVLADRGGSDPEAAAGGGGEASAIPARERSRDEGAGPKLGERDAGGERPGVAELEERFGAAQTRLSREVSGELVSLFEDLVRMGEMVADPERAQAFGGGRWGLQRAIRQAGVELDESQRERAEALFRDYQQRELERSRQALGRLKQDPTVVMELLLNADARSRGQLGEGEYATLQDELAGELEGVINPLDRENFRGGDPLADDEFREGFRALLGPEQQLAFDEGRDGDQAGGADQVRERNLSRLPVMELEQLDDAVGSARQMSSGLLQVMEGMGSLRELGPQLRPQPPADGP